MALSAQIINFTSDTVTVKITGMNTSYRVKSAACSIYELEDDGFCAEYSQDLSSFESEVELSVTTSDCNFETSQHQMVISVIYNNSVDNYEELEPIPFGGYEISVSTTSITFTFNTTRAYYFRCFVKTPDNVTVIDEWVGYHNSGYSITFTGLESGTEYACNAQYSLTDGYGGKWMGKKEFTTLPIWTVKEIVVDPKNDDDSGDLTYTKYPLQIEQYTIYCFKFQSPYSGTASFMTALGSCIKYITLSDEFYLESGEPVDILNSSTTNGFDYGVTKGVTYYYWVRLQNGAKTDNDVMVGIDFPTKDEDSRPAQFSWTYAKIQGQPFNLTAKEWNDLTANINKVRVYKNLSSYFFTTAESGKPFTATMYKQVRNAIRGIAGAGTAINDVEKGYPITAECLNILVTSINNVE